MSDKVSFGYGGISSGNLRISFKVRVLDTVLYMMMEKDGVGTIDAAPTNWYAVDVRHE